MREYNMN